jgi:hypothetical protein
VRNSFRKFSLFVMLLLAAQAGSQSTTDAKPGAPEPVTVAAASPGPQYLGSQRAADERFRIEHERAMARERNKERQAALKKDTDKLLELATQLKEYVDKTNENMLSLDVIKKAEEIEKLSKSVKEKMKAEEYFPPIGPNPNGRR